VDDAMGLFEDNGHGQLGLLDTTQAHLLLTAAGVPEMESLTDRILWVAERWLSLVDHVPSCQCKQCTASRRIQAKAKNWRA
jgi:hypothetical protein